MVCSVRNLSASTERYSTNSSEAWAAMTAINNVASQIQNLSIPQQVDDNVQTYNSTYWRLFVDPSTNPFGQCNGTVVFSAIAG